MLKSGRMYYVPADKKLGFEVQIRAALDMFLKWSEGKMPNWCAVFVGMTDLNEFEGVKILPFKLPINHFWLGFEEI